jgi:xanthine dehydrogenase molybdenum-binding subunit
MTMSRTRCSRDRPDARLLRAREARREEGRQTDSPAGLAGLRRRRLSRRPVGPGCMCVFSLRTAERGRRLRRLRQQAEDAAYRAPGATQAAFACERHRRAGRGAGDRPDRVPPEERREGRHAPRDGPSIRASALSRRCEAARNSDHWKSKLEGKNRGRGIAAGFWFNIGLKSSVLAPT